MEKTFQRMKARPSARHAYVQAEIITSLAHQIKAIRLQRDWTQKELAQKLGTSQTVISRLEDPSYGKYTLKTLLELSHIFDTGLKVQFVPFLSMLSETYVPRPSEREVPAFNDEAEDVGFFENLTPEVTAVFPIPLAMGVQSTATFSPTAIYPEDVKIQFAERAHLISNFCRYIP